MRCGCTLSPLDYFSLSSIQEGKKPKVITLLTLAIIDDIKPSALLNYMLMLLECRSNRPGITQSGEEVVFISMEFLWRRSEGRRSY